MCMVRLLSLRRIGFSTSGAQAKKGSVGSIDLIAGDFFELLVEPFQELVIDLPGASTIAANEVMVSGVGGFVNQLAASHVRDQNEILLCEKAERAIHGGFRRTWNDLLGFLVNLQWGEMPAGLVDDAQDRQPLWGHAVPAGTKFFF